MELNQPPTEMSFEVNAAFDPPSRHCGRHLAPGALPSVPSSPSPIRHPRIRRIPAPAPMRAAGGKTV